MEGVVGSICAKGHASEDAPWELIARMTVVGLHYSNDAPVHQGPEMATRAEDEKTYEGRVVVANNKFYRVGILTRDTDWVHEIMVLFVEPLVEWQSFIFAVESSVGHVEAEVFDNNEDQHVSSHFKRVWKVMNCSPPWDLPIVHPRCECQADKVE